MAHGYHARIVRLRPTESLVLWNMVHKPRFISEIVLQRFEDCASENAILADCWTSDRVVIIACEPTDAYKTVTVSVSPALQLDILSPAANPIWPSLSNASEPARHFCRRNIRQLERPKCHDDRVYWPQFWCSNTGVYQTYSMYDEDARAKAQEVFNDLGAGYASACVASCSISKTKTVLDIFRVRLPATTVFVDMIKVLEHQTRNHDIPQELRMYTNENISVRKQRYHGRPGG
ncbi:uncharacterized protein ColSpa_01504 [Colletotrichum spaethianum]|uniref:Uncharacterized protein n=1 Tax=Colletotrichum spaethianum TaxID=700344 RepID=A0AA37L3L1_9PEZI|nr:uncharacterized protein ColSpa_01504 [Colletotrichum spaethianum]GKT41323.1 hypothetical protein ColSpa_01504 [Colletotrichum spaethianum]